jgi:hypothetical protein
MILQTLLIPRSPNLINLYRLLSDDCLAASTDDRELQHTPLNSLLALVRSFSLLGRSATIK